MSDTRLIKDKIDVVDLVGEYVQLKPAGINHKGLCPFHSEKTPSFMCNRERQSWHCFGCNKGGDIFTFVQEIEGMDFVEALTFLANRAGVELTFQGQNKEVSSQKTRIKDINTEAARFFYKFLQQMDAAKPAKDYIINRGLTPTTIDAWQIGFVPEQWDLLTGYLLKKGFSIDDLVASGLTIKRDGADRTSGRGFYDRFRGRIMFPIHDVHGTVVGFTGRVLKETEHSGGKYVNTPQTIVYDKSRVVFGLHQAKTEARKQDYMVLVEGQMDVIAAHQAGMSNVVATSGTALTDEQIALIKRYTNNLRMAFDTDEAGVKAAKRGIDLALEAGLSVKVIQLPEGAGKDPDECIKKDKTIWFQAVEDASDVMEWYLNRVLQRATLADVRQKQLAIDQILTEIARIPYAVERDHWLGELAGRVGVDIGVLRQDLARVVAVVKKSSSRTREMPQESPAAAPLVRQSRLDRLLERLYALLLRFPELPERLWPRLEPLVVLSTEPYTRLYEAIKNQYTETRLLDLQDLRNAAAKEGENIVDVLLMRAELDFFNTTAEQAREEVETLLAGITTEYQKIRRRSLEQAIAKAEAAGDKAELQRLLREFKP